MPALKFVAYSRSPAELLAIASPLYTALEPEFTAITALVGLTVGFQPKIVPSSVTNRKTAGPELPFAVTAKPLVLLKTRPVGVPPVGLVGDGIVTTRGDAAGWATPSPL